MQSISRAFYKPGIGREYIEHKNTIQCSAVPLAALRCVWWTPRHPPAGVDESSHDAKWRLGDPNLDPDLVSN